MFFLFNKKIKGYYIAVFQKFVLFSIESFSKANLIFAQVGCFRPHPEKVKNKKKIQLKKEKKKKTTRKIFYIYQILLGDFF